MPDSYAKPYEPEEKGGHEPEDDWTINLTRTCFQKDNIRNTFI